MAISSSPKSASEPATIWSAISRIARKSSGRMPRTSAPDAPGAVVAMTWPSTSGDRRDDAAEAARPFAPPRRKSVSGPVCGIDAEMAVEPENAAEQIGAEAVHHRHDDDQRRDAERDAEQRKDRDDRDEAFLPPRPQIAERDHPLERVEDHVDCVSPFVDRSKGVQRIFGIFDDAIPIIDQHVPVQFYPAPDQFEFVRIDRAADQTKRRANGNAKHFRGAHLRGAGELDADVMARSALVAR